MVSLFAVAVEYPGPVFFKASAACDSHLKSFVGDAQQSDGEFVSVGHNKS